MNYITKKLFVFIEIVLITTLIFSIIIINAKPTKFDIEDTENNLKTTMQDKSKNCHCLAILDEEKVNPCEMNKGKELMDKDSDTINKVKESKENLILNSNEFISRWNTTKTSEGSSNDSQIMLPLQETGTYNFEIDWGDGTTDTIETWDQTEVTHNYTMAGEYTIVIEGILHGWLFDNSGDKQKLIEISHWGDIRLGNSGSYFYGCENLVLTATDAPDLTGTTTLYRAFQGCLNLGSIGDMNSWNVSGITNMERMFYSGSLSIPFTNFNQSLSSWNVSKVTKMGWMFYNARDFNQNISKWNVSSLTDMNRMFGFAKSFNQNLNNWNVSSVTKMEVAFYGAESFNQPLDRWDISNVVNMDRLFYRAYSFNQDIGAWNVSSVLNMKDMFNDVTLSIPNYDSILFGWSQLSLQPDLEFHAGDSQYSSFAASAKDSIITDFSWTITDGGEAPDDDIDPEITNITHTPLEVNNLDIITISALVTDNIAVVNVLLHYSIDGGPLHNVTMTATESLYSSSIGTFTTDSIIEYHINATDYYNNRAISDNSSFTIIDNLTPEITDVLFIPDAPTAQDEIFITAHITDNVAIDTAILSYYINDGGQTNITMTVYDVSIYNATIGAFNEGDSISFYIQAYDTAGNTIISDTKFFSIPDVTSPVIEDINYPESPTELDQINISITVNDNVQVDTVILFYTVNNGDQINVTMTDMGTTYNASIGTFNVSDVLTFFIFANDTSGNEMNSSEYTITIIDGTLPIITNINYTPTSPTDQDNITISATVTDNIAIGSVILYYRIDQSAVWSTIAMIANGSTFNVTIGSFSANNTIEFFIEAKDTANNIATSKIISFTISSSPDTLPSSLTTFEIISIIVGSIIVIGALITGTIFLYKRRKIKTMKKENV